MSRIVFLLEERSMKAFLSGFLPRYFPSLDFLCLAHEGKQDLEKSIPRKLRAWKEPGVRFVVVRDNDNDHCVQLKRRLVDLCTESGRPETLVRLACQELEAWYLGDPDALATAYGNERLSNIHKKSKFRDSDKVTRPAEALSMLIPEFQKVAGARLMGTHLNDKSNSSCSFGVFLSGLRRICSEMNNDASTTQ